MTRRLWAFVLAVAAAALASAWAWGMASQPIRFERPWLWVAIVILAAIDHAGLSVSILHLRANERIGVEEAFFVAMAFLFEPFQILSGLALAALIGGLLSTRAPIKLIFNIAQYTLALSGALVVMRADGPPSQGDALHTGLVVLGAAVFLVLNITLLSTLFSIIENRSFLQIVREHRHISLMSWSGAIAIGTVAGLAGRESDTALAIGLIAVIVLELVLSREQQATLDRERMRALLGSSREIHSSTTESDRVIETTLRSVRDLLRCGSARISEEGPGAGELATKLETDTSPRWLVAGDPLSEKGFESRDQDVLDTIGAVSGVALVNARLYEEILIEHERLEKSQDQVIRSQRIEAVGHAAGGLAHDFNNYLAVIKAYTNMLIEDLKSHPKALKDLKEIRAAAQKASELVGELLEFAHMGRVSPQKLDLNGTILQMSNLLETLAGPGTRLELDLAPDLRSTLADPHRIQQILTNLVANARDAVKPGGTIRIHTSNLPSDTDASGSILLSVSDNGHGMDADTIGQVFEPFFTTKPADKGTGLGLSTVYGIVERSGGSIDVHSEPGEGTKITITLPSLPERSRELQT